MRAGGRMRRVLTGPWSLALAFLVVHVVLVAVNLLDTYHQPLGDVTGVYRFWVDYWHTEHRLVGIDTAWVYPVGALPPMLVADAFGDAWYAQAWLGIVVLLDALATLLLARRSLPLAWWWIAFTACLGPIALARIDSVALPVAVIGVLYAARRPAVASVLFTLAAWIKVWPAALIAAMLVAGRRAARVVAAAALTSAVVIAVAVAVGGRSTVFSFVAAQTGRRLQIEAPVTSVWLWEAAAGSRGTRIYYDRAILTFQVTGQGADATAAVMTAVLAVGVLVVTGLGLLARLRGGDPGEVLALTALGFVGAVIALNKVGSPQYLTWYVAPVLLGLLAAPRRFRVPAVLVLVLAALTQVVYPWFYYELLLLNPVLLTVLSLRNLLELVLLAWTVSVLAGLRGPAPSRSGRSIHRALAAPAGR